MEILLASQKLEDFIRRTLDIARSTRLNIKPLKLNNLIEEAIQEVSFASTPIVRKYDYDMPEVMGDHQLLLMAFKNLLTNAAEAITDNGQISIETKWAEKAVIKISDSGIGIPEDRLTSIFRPFFSMKDQGHGLGLAMVKKAVISHQGNIKVESKKGEGSTFTITLPGIV